MKIAIRKFLQIRSLFQDPVSFFRSWNLHKTSNDLHSKGKERKYIQALGLLGDSENGFIEQSSLRSTVALAKAQWAGAYRLLY